MLHFKLRKKRRQETVSVHLPQQPHNPKDNLAPVTGRPEKLGVASTIRKCEEEILRQSEARYRDFFESAKDAIYVHDLSGRYTMVNRAGEELIGYSRGEILRLSIFDIVPRIYLDRIQGSLRKKLADHSPTIYEVEIIRK